MSNETRPQLISEVSEALNPLFDPTLKTCRYADVKSKWAAARFIQTYGAPALMGNFSIDDDVRLASHHLTVEKVGQMTRPTNAHMQTHNIALPRSVRFDLARELSGLVGSKGKSSTLPVAVDQLDSGLLRVSMAITDTRVPDDADIETRIRLVKQTTDIMFNPDRCTNNPSDFYWGHLYQAGQSLGLTDNNMSSQILNGDTRFNLEFLRQLAQSVDNPDLNIKLNEELTPKEFQVAIQQLVGDNAVPPVSMPFTKTVRRQFNGVRTELELATNPLDIQVQMTDEGAFLEPSYEQLTGLKLTQITTAASATPTAELIRSRDKARKLAYDLYRAR